MQKYKVIGVTNALTDIQIPITDQELNNIGLDKGRHTFIKNINLQGIHDLINERVSKKFIGGGPTNTIRSMNNLGFQCSLIGAVGEDDIGKEFISQLYAEGIEPYFLMIPNKESGKCFVFITPDGERSFVVNQGIYANYPDVNFRQLPKQDLFYTSGYELISNSERMLGFAKSLKQIGTKISFDLASELMVTRCPEKFEEVISYSEIVFGSEEEINAFGKLENKIINGRIFILKKGKEGSEIYHEGRRIKISPVRLNKLVNLNGAGDSYAAGFLAAYMQGKDLEYCGNFACHIASEVCSQEESCYLGN
jgi:sugar/nucleoside kinase (ribokinase family)